MIYLYLYLCILFNSNFLPFHERLCVLNVRFNGRKVAPTIKEIQVVMKDEGINASYYTENRARLKVEENVRGSSKDSFSYIHSWLDMLKDKNAGTFTTITTDSQN